MAWWRERFRRQGAHLTDSRLLDMVIPSPSSGHVTHSDSPDAHLVGCPGCAKRLADLKAFLGTLAEDHTADFDDAFSEEHLAHQRASIRRRLERATRPATSVRILRFPAAARPALAQVRTARWWLGAAAAVGLLGGVGLGQFVHVHPESTGAEPALTRAASSASGFSRVDATPPSGGSAPAEADAEAFMDRVESVLVDPQIRELTTLDAITPRVREVALSPW